MAMKCAEKKVKKYSFESQIIRFALLELNVTGRKHGNRQDKAAVLTEPTLTSSG